jgi:hypothetical protein
MPGYRARFDRGSLAPAVIGYCARFEISHGDSLPQGASVLSLYFHFAQL